MKKFFLVLLTGLLLVGCNSNEPADDPTLLDENFDICSVMDDAEFKAFCLKNFDTDGDGKLSFIEGISITEIDVSGAFGKNTTGTIKSLKGIEYFSALTHLDCSHNQLSSLDVSINTALTYLDCSNNQLSSLDVSTNTALTSLNCYKNQLTVLDVSTKKALKWLNCYNNQLNILDVSNNTELTYLDCRYNPLQTLYIKTGQTIENLSKPDETKIEYK